MVRATSGQAPGGLNRFGCAALLGEPMSPQSQISINHPRPPGLRLVIVFEPQPAPPHAPATHTGFRIPTHDSESNVGIPTLASERRAEQIRKQGNRLDFGWGGRTCTRRVKRYDDGNNTKLQLCGTDGGDRRRGAERDSVRIATTIQLADMRGGAE